ncbi:MAG: family 43 glycosylhydrolase [Bacteroidota bacterium]
MIKIIYSIIFIIIALSQVFAQKPILPDFHADPSAHIWDGKYWIYPSTDEPVSLSWMEMKRWHCYSSTNLVEWTNEGEIFNLDSVSWADKAAFAPDAVKWKGNYYYYFPADFQIGVAIAHKPNGPFTDALGEPLIKRNAVEGVASFDPCIFIDSDSIPYLYYGGGNGVAVSILKNNLIEIKGEIRKLELEGYHEGIWVHKKDSLYYFSYPKLIKQEGKIKQLLVYSTAPSPLGPFTYRGMFFDNNSRNSHHSIIKIKDRWYLFYHVEGPSPYERRVCVEYLYYNEDGTIKEVIMTKKGIEPIK